jgi:hypothetical protein
MGTELVKYGPENSIEVKSRKKPVFRNSRAYAALTPDERQIIDAALEAKEQWREAGLNFENVTDDLLVDYYIYWMKACESRYTYYLRLAKEKGLSHFLQKSVIYGKVQKYK